MKKYLSHLMLLLLPACARCTGEDLAPPPVASADPPAPVNVPDNSDAKANDPTLKGHAGDVDIQGSPSLLRGNRFRKQQR